MTDDFEDLFEKADDSELRAYIQKIAEAYSTKLALDLIEAHARPFARVVEDVQIDHGECRRKLTIDWQLPSLAEALPNHEHIDDARLIDKFAELNPTLVVPVFLMRRGRLMNNFCAEGSGGERLYVCGQEEWVERTRFVLGTFWALVDNTKFDTEHHWPGLVAEAQKEFFSIPELRPGKALDTIDSVAEKLLSSQVRLVPGLLERIRLVGRYLAKRHVVWLHLPGQPGQGVRLTISYRTRFAAEYPPHRTGNSGNGLSRLYQRALNCVRRVVGQEPYQFHVPLAMNALCGSYHFHMAAPPSTYFTSQRFVLEKNLHQSETDQQKAFEDYYRGNGALVDGRDEAGGPVAHLYARHLPTSIGNQMYAYAEVRERPPGTTALVMWLSLLAAGFLWFYYTIWPWLVAKDTNGIDVAALFVALPGIASIWFSRAFREDVRPRVPLVSRFGLAVVGASAFYSLLAILVQRGICQPQGPDEHLAACPAALTDTFSRTALLVIASMLTAVGLWLVVRRILFHKEYQQKQKLVTDRYIR